MQVSGLVADPIRGRIFPGTLTLSEGRISSVRVDERPLGSGVIVPGFVDAHIHIESSMLPPSQFASLALRRGTVATVSDPHEIANVLGVEGVRWMVADAARSPLHVAFGASPCVPATPFETAGAHLDSEAVRELLEDDGLPYLSEVMNYPGVLGGDPELMAMIGHAQRLNRPIDGHAPGLRGDDARRYAEAGPQTDHECFTLEEAHDKLAAGMSISIREGSAAKNYDALQSLISTHTDRCMLCSDDLHPDDLANGHIDALCARAVADGHDPLKVLRVACINPVRHYRLPIGTLGVGDWADFAIVRDLRSFEPIATYRRGQEVSRFSVGAPDKPNAFTPFSISAGDLHVEPKGAHLRVIVAQDGQLVTGSEWVRAQGIDTGQDVLKIVVCNRYAPGPPAVAFVRGFGLKRGAMATSVAHDSHNVVAVGASDEALVEAISKVIDARGGLAVAGADVEPLPLPIAGLMSDLAPREVASRYEALDSAAKALGCELTSPFITLSFMALLVIPSLKLSDKGLFDGEAFEFAEMWRS